MDKKKELLPGRCIPFFHQNNCVYQYSIDSDFSHLDLKPYYSNILFFKFVLNMKESASDAKAIMINAINTS